MFSLRKLFLLFLMILSPHVGEDDDVLDSLESEETETEEEESELEESEEEEEIEIEATEKPKSRAQKEITTLRERAQTAEAQHRQAQVDLEAARRQPFQPAQPTNEQKLWEAEQATLNNPEATDWQRYSVQSARDSRAALAQSQAALTQAQDFRDQAEFAALAQTKPKTVEKYRDRVEEAKKKFPSAPRKELLAFIVGQEMLAGKLKTTESKPAKKAGAPRGSTPGARSDVTSSSRGGKTEYEKAMARLDGKKI
jgi:hypothetical protein